MDEELDTRISKMASKLETQKEINLKLEKENMATEKEIVKNEKK